MCITKEAAVLYHTNVCFLSIVFVESEKDSQLENEHVSSYRQHPQLKLVNKFGNLNRSKLFKSMYMIRSMLCDN